MLNNILFIVFIIFFGIFIITLLINSIFFLIKGFKNRMYNIIIIGFGFAILSLGFISNLVLNLGQLFQEFSIFISFILLVIFTNLTFHKNRGFIPNIVLISVIILGLVQIGFFIYSIVGTWTLSLYYLRVWLDLPYTFLTFNWLAYSSFSSYLLMKSQKVNPWIKMRYKMVAIFSFIFSFSNIPEFFQPPGTTWAESDNVVSLLVFGITTMLVIVFSLGFALAWIMPTSFKKFLDRNYEIDEEVEYQERELIDLIKKQLSQKDEKL